MLITTFPLNNVRTLLLSGISKPYDPKTGEGVVGRNYSYQTTGGAAVFMMVAAAIKEAERNH